MSEEKFTKKQAETKEAFEQAGTEADAVSKKLAAMKEYAEQVKINGIQIIDVNEQNKVLRSNLLIAGQTLPMFIVLNDTVYSYIQIHLAAIDKSKEDKCLKYLNELNEKFSMLKYHINSENNVVLTCSVPSSNDKFEPALVFALVDQVKILLEENYTELMQTLWKD